jgi:hypothetical protein
VRSNIQRWKGGGAKSTATTNNNYQPQLALKPNHSKLVEGGVSLSLSVVAQLPLPRTPNSHSGVTSRNIKPELL